MAEATEIPDDMSDPWRSASMRACDGAGAQHACDAAAHACDGTDARDPWLVVNGFVRSSAFDGLYEMLLDAAVREGIPLRLVRTTDVPHDPAALAGAVPEKVIFWDKDVVFARMLERAGARLFNSAWSIAACDDKALCAAELASAGLPVPVTASSPLAFQALEDADMAFALRDAERLGYPVVLKEVFGSFGQGVQLIRDARQLQQAIRALGAKRFVLQEFIAESAGSDIRIAVVGGRVLAAMRRTSADGDFRSNIAAGARAEAYEPTAAEADAALRACAALGLDFAGVDILRSSEGPLICEVNSNPHFHGLLEATGVNMADAIVALLARASV